MNQDQLNMYKSILQANERKSSTQLRLYITNQEGNPITNGEVYVLGTDKSAVIDESGYVLIDDMCSGDHCFSLTTPLGTNTYGPYHFKQGKPHTFHVQVNSNSSLITPMVNDRTALAIRKR